MGKTIKLVSILLLIVCLMGILPVSAVGAGTAEPDVSTAVSKSEPEEPRRWEPHCGTLNQTGVLVISYTTSQVGSQVRACIHGRLSHTDHRYMYQDYVTYDCTLCSFYSKLPSGAPYWGEWIC